MNYQIYLEQKKSTNNVYIYVAISALPVVNNFSITKQEKKKQTNHVRYYINGRYYIVQPQA